MQGLNAFPTRLRTGTKLSYSFGSITYGIAFVSLSGAVL